MGYPSSRFSYAAPQPALLLVVRKPLRLKDYSLRTEHSYIRSIRRVRAR
jgi:hypothetical protein